MVKMRKILALLLALLTLVALPLMSWGDGIETQAKSLILVEGLSLIHISEPTRPY